MAEIAQRAQVILIHEIIKYHIERSQRGGPPSSTDPKSQNRQHTIHESLQQQGYYLGSKIISRLTIRKGCILDPNKCMVFICRELCIYLFGKQAARLQSNSQGVYIVFCDQIYWFDCIQFKPTKSDIGFTVDELKSFYLSLASGIIRGSLESLGFSSTVDGSVEEQYKFTVQLHV